MNQFKKTIKLLSSVLFLCALPVVAQTFGVLASFDGTDQTSSIANVVQAADGNLYGTTVYGGPTNNGTVYKVTPAGVITTLYNFCSLAACADGAQPYVGLTLGADGNLYGTTNFGGPSNFGTIFKLTLGGVLTTLHTFNGADGATPQAGLILASNGVFYGNTLDDGSAGFGTLYAIKPDGTFRTLHNFGRSETDGGNPYTPPVQASDGNLYGITYDGGFADSGTVYRATLGGVVTTIHSFCTGRCTDGQYPLGGLAQGPDGNLYGTAAHGTNAGCGAFGCGDIFKMTTSGHVTVLHVFDYTDGGVPLAALTLGNDGVFYSTTSLGGSSNCSDGCGTIFSITTDGTFTSLYTFCLISGCPDGYYPQASPLFQETNGTFYDATPYGGSAGEGVVYTLSAGLPAFVTPSPAAAAVGSRVTILGNNLTGATAVSFNGTAATFTTSRSAIIATVPAGATTGPITVTLPSSTLTSKINFIVEP